MRDMPGYMERVGAGIRFMVNEMRGLLSSTFECVNSHADLKQRRTAPYPDFIAAQIDAFIDQHRQLSWDAPVSGSMSA